MWDLAYAQTGPAGSGPPLWTQLLSLRQQDPVGHQDVTIDASQRPDVLFPLP